MKKHTINFLNSLKMSSSQKKESLIITYSNHILELVFCLYENGYIQSYKILHKNKIIIYLRYYFNHSVFNNFKIISKPSNLRFLKFEKLTLLPTKKTTIFLSTDKGILTLDQCKKQKLGGVILFYC